MGADAGFAQVRFTRDWRNVLRLDPGADIELLQALERDIASGYRMAGRDEILYRLQDLCFSAIQISVRRSIPDSNRRSRWIG